MSAPRSFAAPELTDENFLVLSLFNGWSPAVAQGFYFLSLDGFPYVLYDLPPVLVALTLLSSPYTRSLITLPEGEIFPCPWAFGLLPLPLCSVTGLGHG